METPEFRAVRFWLTKRQQILSNGGELIPSELDYISYIEKHIEWIDPHYETLTINGEKRKVKFLTRIVDNHDPTR